MPNMDWQYCQLEILLGRGDIGTVVKVSGRKNMETLTMLDLVFILRNPTHHRQNLDVSALKHAYTRVLNSVRVQQLDPC